MNVIDENRKLRVNVRNPCGPQRVVLHIHHDPSATLITFACGHTGRFAQHFDYSKEKEMSCFQCRFSSDNVISQEALEPEIAAQY